MSDSSKPDGGPAFPTRAIPQLDSGMTLRDWFAGQALAGICSDAECFWDEATSLAYEYADAMLAARERRSA